MSYLSCIKKVKGVNEDECRMLAKSYLTCRMDRWVIHELTALPVVVPLSRKCRLTRKRTATSWQGTNSKIWDSRKRKHQQRKVGAMRRESKESSGGDCGGRE